LHFLVSCMSATNPSSASCLRIPALLLYKDENCFLFLLGLVFFYFIHLTLNGLYYFAMIEEDLYFVHSAGGILSVAAAGPACALTGMRLDMRVTGSVHGRCCRRRRRTGES
jgi:hypothetical protein